MADAARPSACGTTVSAASWQAPGSGGLPMKAAAPAAAIDPAGDDQILFDEQDLGGRDLLTWASRAPSGSWSTAPVGSEEASQATLVIDPAGVAHGCFVRARSDSTGPIDCVDRTPAGGFVPSRVDASAAWGPSLALDPAGGLYVVYARTDGIWLGHRTASSDWSTERIAAGSFARAALAVDAAGGLHVACVVLENGEQDLRMMERPAGGTWTTQLLDAGEDSLTGQSLAADPAGHLHLVFASNYAGAELDDAEWSPAASWIIRRGIGFGSGTPTSFAVTALDGRVQVAYFARSNDATQPSEVRLARRDPGGTWTDEVVEQVWPFETNVSIAADASGAAHVVYDAVDASFVMRALDVTTVCAR